MDPSKFDGCIDRLSAGRRSVVKIARERMEGMEVDSVVSCNLSQITRSRNASSRNTSSPSWNFFLPPLLLFSNPLSSHLYYLISDSKMLLQLDFYGGIYFGFLKILTFFSADREYHPCLKLASLPRSKSQKKRDLNLPTVVR